MRKQTRRARRGDIHDIAMAMPFTTREGDSPDRAVYQVGGRSFVFCRNPRPDAIDERGERMSDVIVIWVPSGSDKQSLVQDESPFFTTPHFNGHPSVLLRARDVGRLTLAELTEVVQDAWLSRASDKRAQDWLDVHAPHRWSTSMTEPRTPSSIAVHPTGPACSPAPRPSGRTRTDTAMSDSPTVAR